MTTRDEKLVAYLDGEADAATRSEVDRWLAESQAAQRTLRDLEIVGDILRENADVLGRRGEGIADHVMAEVAKEDAAAGLRPVGFGGTVSRTAGPRRPGRNVYTLVPALGLALAAAAAVVVYLVPPHRQVQTPEPVGVRVVAPEAPTGSAPVSEVVAADEASAEGGGASIESVDFGGHNGTIFMVDRGPEVTPVVWLVDDGTATGDRMKAL